jgi:hypothetical protein
VRPQHAAAEDRAGNHAVFALFGFTASSSLISAPSSVFTRRGFAPAAADGNHAFSAQLTRSKELTDGDDVLIIKMPDLFRQAHRLKEMDVRPDQPRRMRAGKLVKRDLPLRMTAKLAAAGLADVDFPVVRRVSTVSPASKAFAGQNNRLRVCAERVGIHGRDENRGRHVPGTGIY